MRWTGSFGCVLLIAVLILTPLCSRQSGPQGNVHHTVVVWLNEPGNAEVRQKLIDASRQFKKIPGVLRVNAGEVLPSDRKIVDSSFDIAVIVTFTDRKAPQGYLEHPIHKKATEELLKPLAKKTVIYDFVD